MNPEMKTSQDLPALATLDFAALKDIRQTGIEYCRHYEALLHNTPGLQPGYLPEEESRHLVTGVSNFLFTLHFPSLLLGPTLQMFSLLILPLILSPGFVHAVTSILFRRTLGKTQTRGLRSHPGGSGGGTPNHFHPFLQNFGYSSSDDAASEVSDTAPSMETRLVEEIYSQAQ